MSSDRSDKVTTLDLIGRVEVLSLRQPSHRTGLHARFIALRRVIRDMGYDPEVLDFHEWQGRKLTLAEKTYVLLLFYCGINHEQALATLLRLCGVEMTEREIARRASMIGRSVERTFIGPAIQLILRDAERVLDLTPERTLAELYTLAMGNFADVAEWYGGTLVLKDMSSLTRAQTALIAQAKQVVNKDGSTTWEIKLHDKLKALELLAKHQGLLVEKIEVSVDQTLGQRIEAARRRVLEGEVVRERIGRDG